MISVTIVMGGSLMGSGNHVGGGSGFSGGFNIWVGSQGSGKG